MSEREYSYPKERSLVSLMSNGLVYRMVYSAASLTYDCPLASRRTRSIVSYELVPRGYSPN
jgi:hypothetical protein